MVEADLREALAGGEGLQLHYQPLYANGGRRMIGAEALLRWDHPVHGALSPDFVVSIAEESGLMLALGDWVLREACKMAAASDVPWIAVNVSPTQLRDEGFARRVLAIIATQGIRPGQIQIEVTETVLMADPVVAEAALRELRAAGVRIALDDFGTGYSSMSYLRQYSIDKLKIDRSFIRGLDDADGRAMVAAIVEMAHALKLDVTAEGVETAQQRDALFTLGCNEMQGFLFSKPLSAGDFVSTVGRKAAPLRA
jgi:EAL domain-containing protein (putative c-di-GMP-specific phosphodiesterase class I)